ncbi:hypothetical protein J2S17_002490 [Cytobacillus purgationiresistens]|uniref:DUF5673 domain-containing protein n=2 Tax=Cytobacillus purgationiresistens TaxID=863449 RepID=A0ABU0AHT2_9BACI|nr:hypothetical protein [Cytobacillus purgationiresistens]
MLILDGLFLMIIGFYLYRFIRILFKMKQDRILPVANEEMKDIRIEPQRPIDSPSVPSQKWGIIVYSMSLLFIISVFIIGISTDFFDWSIYLLLFLPLVHSENLFNQFIILDDGLVKGSRYVPWGKIKSFSFVPIDINHQYFGFSKEVNDGYELKIESRFLPIRCIVTSDAMKEKLNQTLNERLTHTKNKG